MGGSFPVGLWTGLSNSKVSPCFLSTESLYDLHMKSNQSSLSDLRLCWSIRVRAMMVLPVGPLSLFLVSLSHTPSLFSSFLLQLLLSLSLIASHSSSLPSFSLVPLHCRPSAPHSPCSTRYPFYPYTPHTKSNGHVLKSRELALLLDPRPHLLLPMQLDLCQHCPIKVLSTFLKRLPSRILPLDSNNSNRTRTGSDRYQESTLHPLVLLLRHWCHPTLFKTRLQSSGHCNSSNHSTTTTFLCTTTTCAQSSP